MNPIKSLFKLEIVSDTNFWSVEIYGADSIFNALSIDTKMNYPVFRVGDNAYRQLSRWMYADNTKIIKRSIPGMIPETIEGVPIERSDADDEFSLVNIEHYYQLGFDYNYIRGLLDAMVEISGIMIDWVDEEVGSLDTCEQMADVLKKHIEFNDF